MLPKEIDEIFDIISNIPNFSKKQATNFVFYLLSKNKNNLKKNIDNLLELINKISECEICHYFSNEKLCNICNSKTRENKLLLVENVHQIQKYEDWKIFNGKYFLIPNLFNKKFEKINENNFNIDFFLKYIKDFNEIIIAISPDVEGVLTSNFIFDKIKENYPMKNVTKLAIGLPIGSSVDYVDEKTFSYALKNRKDII